MARHNIIHISNPLDANVCFVIVFSAKPFVKKFESKSKNLVQGDPLVLKCAVYADPTPNITWYKDDVKLDQESKPSPIFLF